MRSSILFDRRFIINKNNLEKLYEYYQEGKLSHAYLISTNNIQKCMTILLNVIKNIFCYGLTDDKKDSLCHLIDINNLPTLKIIEPDGNFIKKNQVLELQTQFSKTSQYTKESIYILKNCEKMNKESANTMLKFLEEPSDNIIGFFITNNYDNVIPTIQSRCQKVDMFFSNTDYENINITKEEYDELLNIVNPYLEKIESKNNDLVLINRELFSDYEKDKIISIFQIMLIIYKKVLNYKYNLGDKDEDYNYLYNYSTSNISRKIKLIIEILKEINYNINVELLMDRFVIEMDGINHETI